MMSLKTTHSKVVIGLNLTQVFETLGVLLLFEAKILTNCSLFLLDISQPTEEAMENTTVALFVIIISLPRFTQK